MGDEIMVLLPNLSQTLKINDPEERHLLGNVTWEQYEALLTDFGDNRISSTNSCCVVN
jgi:hypothetical protein